MPKETQEHHYGSNQPITVKAAANYLGMGVKNLQKKTREGKVLGYTRDEGARHHWEYYISDLDDNRHRHCSRPAENAKQQEDHRKTCKTDHD